MRQLAIGDGHGWRDEERMRGLDRRIDLEDRRLRRRIEESPATAACDQAEHKTRTRDGQPTA